MRTAFGVATTACLLAALAACVRGAPAPAQHAEIPQPPVGAPIGPPQYVVGDPSQRDNIVAVPLGAGGAYGLVVDKTRIVVGRGEPRIGEGMTAAPILGALPIPPRFGGGFLFWTESSLYRSASFEGALEPIARTPSPISSISFAPKFLLVRANTGERWSLGLPKGERVSLDPLGVADVEGLEDGRALAFDDRGSAFSSIDSGAHWTDVTTQLKAAPVRVANVDDELWFFENGGTAARLEKDGQLSFFDKQPLEKTAAVRASDPRWRGSESPLRTVFHSGATVDEGSAIVVEDGDLVRVDVHTGDILGVVAGKLPPQSTCEGVPTPNDVLFACVSPATNTAGPRAYVISHTLSNDAPIVEQTFQTASNFWSSDDGGLAFHGACNGDPPTENSACVRQPGGSWQDVDISGLADASSSSYVHVVRWIPRGDGHAVALLAEQPMLGLFDPLTGVYVPIETTAYRELTYRELTSDSQFGAPNRFRGHGMPPQQVVYGSSLPTLVDGSWSFSNSGALRGWSRHGDAFEISEDGKVTRSPYSLEIVSAGANGLGRTAEGRFYQSTDHGASWIEVAAPPTGAAGDLRACSTAGCDLGGFYRVGWATRPPQSEIPPTDAKPAPEVRRVRPVELACRATGPAVVKVLKRTESSPEDLGLGDSHLPVAGDRAEIGFLRNALQRGIEFPLADRAPGDTSEGAALRAVVSGPSTTTDNGSLEVMAANKSPLALRRQLSFVPAFDPASPIKRATIAMSDVLGAGHLAGLSNDEILQDDMTETGAVIVMTPHDGLTSDLAYRGTRGLLAWVHGERVKIGIRAAADDTTVVSGAVLSGDEAVFLELEATGAGRVFKLGAGGPMDLFEMNPNASEASLYPANPDAIAIGPKDEVALLRTGSGSEPPSAQDPALVLQPQVPAIALAPWSTLRLADDAACKEPGWRATLQVIAPWMRITAPELHVSDPVVPMIARVKWNETRVCLEGLELRLPEVSVRVPSASGSDATSFATWLVSRNGQFARVAIAEGLEWRQPLECSVKPRS